MKIALDVMGYENDLSHAIKAARKFKKHHHSVSIILVGNQDQINKLIKPNEFEVVHANDVIKMDDNPMMALRNSNSSMYKAIKLVADNNADGVLSAGSTPCYIALVYFLLKTIKDISKPGFMPFLPASNKKFLILMDAGANKTCSGEDLYNFAKMTDVYAKHVENIPNPKIGIINIGTEKEKGFEYHQKAYDLLSNDKSMNFVGYLEPRYILNGVVDIAINDGYTGNLVLKSVEGGLKALTYTMKKSFKKPWNWLSALFSLGVIHTLKKTYDYKSRAGAIVMGVTKPAVKTHGSADWEQFLSSLELLYRIIDKDIISKIKNNLNK